VVLGPLKTAGLREGMIFFLIPVGFQQYKEAISRRAQLGPERQWKRNEEQVKESGVYWIRLFEYIYSIRRTYALLLDTLHLKCSKFSINTKLCEQPRPPSGLTGPRLILTLIIHSNYLKEQSRQNTTMHKFISLINTANPHSFTQQQMYSSFSTSPHISTIESALANQEK